MGKASDNFASHNRGSGHLEFSPPRPTGASFATRSLDSISASLSAGSTLNSYLRCRQFPHGWICIAQEQSFRKDSISITDLIAPATTYKPRITKVARAARTHTCHKAGRQTTSLLAPARNQTAGGPREGSGIYGKTAPSFHPANSRQRNNMGLASG
jgi:hypothetical protein